MLESSAQSVVISGFVDSDNSDIPDELTVLVEPVPSSRKRRRRRRSTFTEEDSIISPEDFSPAETPLKRFKRAYTDAQIAESRCNIDELGIRKCQVRTTTTHLKK